MRILVQQKAFDAGAELNAFTAEQDNAGALVSFTGIVRNSASGTLKYMRIEHYPGMTEKALRTITEDAQRRWSVQDVLIIHRYGDFGPGETIMMVAVAARHRADAFAAADFLMDFLKSRAPFWKQEVDADGSTWVAAKDSDESALGRW